MLGSGIAHPPLPLRQQMWDWMQQALTRSGGNPSAGLALHRTFLEAGLPPPQMRAHAPVNNGVDANFDLAVAGVRTWLPRILEFGIATAEEIDVDTLGERLRAAFAAEQRAAIGPISVDAWARKP